MIAIPLYVLLILYILLVLGSVIFFLFDIYHIVAAGDFSITTFIATAFVGGSLLLVLGGTWFALAEQNIDWNSSLPIFNSSWVSAPDSF